MQYNNICDAFNLGSGIGFSIKEILSECMNITGTKIDYKIFPPREGDPASLIADIEKAQNYLSWKPQHSDIKNIISSAWKWHAKDI